MNGDVGDLRSAMEQRMLRCFKDLMTRVASFEESAAVGNKFLVSFQQGLELLRRPALSMESELVGKIIKANESKRLLSYFEAGCINVHDSMQKVRTCLLELQEHIIRAKAILEESECLLSDATLLMQTANECLLPNQDTDCNGKLANHAIMDDEGEAGEAAVPNYQNPELGDYATIMAIIYNMMKQDFSMQEKIVSALDLKLPSGELESYCSMWSLRPFIDDELMRDAWKLVQ